MVYGYRVYVICKKFKLITEKYKETFVILNVVKNLISLTFRFFATHKMTLK